MSDHNYSESDEVTGSVFGLRAKRTATKMLELRLKTGDSVGIAYHWLQSLNYEPHRIKAIFTAFHVEITGRHLKDLYRALLEHRVPFIQEGDALYDKTPQSAVFVSGISVQPK